MNCTVSKVKIMISGGSTSEVEPTIMGTVLIICRNLNIRKFYVDNLTARGYRTVGITSLSEDGIELLEGCSPGHFIPSLALMWGELTALEPDIAKFRQSYANSVPIIVVSQQKPDPDWMTKWQIAAHSSGLSDSRHLTDFLQPWLR